MTITKRFNNGKSLVLNFDDNKWSNKAQVKMANFVCHKVPVIWNVTKIIAKALWNGLAGLALIYLIFFM